MKPYSKRLSIFIELCYKGLPFRVAKLSGINLTTLKKWLGGSDMKLSSIEKLSEAGLNISWLVSGMGTMFAHNIQGKSLGDSREVEIAVIEHFKKTFKSKNMDMKLNEIKNDVVKRDTKQEQVEEFLTRVKGWYHEVNRNSSYTLTNYFLYTFRNGLQSRRDQSILTTGDTSIALTKDDDLVMILPIIISFALDYLGPDLNHILGDFIPDFVLNNFLPENIVDKGEN